MTATLTAEQNAFLEECMSEFSDRFSDNDLEYKRVHDSDLPPPPIMCPWYGRPKLTANRHRGPGNSRSYERDYPKDGDNYRRNNEQHKFRDQRYRPY